MEYNAGWQSWSLDTLHGWRVQWQKIIGWPVLVSTNTAMIACCSNSYINTRIWNHVSKVGVYIYIIYIYIYMSSQILTALTKLCQRSIRLALSPIDSHIWLGARIEKAIGTLQEGKGGECVKGLFEERHVYYVCTMKACVESKHGQELKSSLYLREYCYLLFSNQPCAPWIYTIVNYSIRGHARPTNYLRKE